VFSEWDVLNDTLGSDHLPAITCINVFPVEDSDHSKKFLTSKADWSSFKNNSRKLLKTDVIVKNKTVDENTEALTNAIIKAAELSIPQRKNSKRKRLKCLPYWNKNCKKAIRDRNKARNAMHKN